jgi:hypothetical protein
MMRLQLAFVKRFVVFFFHYYIIFGQSIRRLFRGQLRL